ncbi:MAG: UDP-N-acetyl-D-glucosamine 2-epimerase, UDP-hydrolysing [Candidatus Zambryskibacteria bacterium RIFOXYC1_FULL_39_10]|uniref:UDP-N-acetyl-D-glucosamine 2-epimerase, UDP-hydrolysing n=1 Tax=Candidatus Zambryskibacteria bacterium RIFOXYC1_FULL_39_10 TaxID=1802779 RepID=A0A1G2V3J5_9BACT|nr:MAG: UDP-N-acetyl-D-glucosamine 2-epimerase, UDP-hydrolysing [Candidatus Zambryskibacteria bacterium RIFOXYC1_FULL_39_10]OHB16743.1 MAG: UDP-N-acetyl-D-glucosamine 2-epimerase, UDP-hydrolysing [Candidatus Zambryskibacteria bacterium RIFOXYD1_FULL_39_35]
MISSRQKNKKIFYVSGTRADFGLMLPVLRAIKASKSLDLILCAAGEHLMFQFGKTINDIKKHFPEVHTIKTSSKSDEKTGVAEFNANFFKKITIKLKEEKPDLVLVLGDRSEMLLTAVACLYLGIPIAHIHGGEKTGTVDEVSRHAITKISNIHFPATKDAASRIKRMGEDSWRINIVGAPALDTILNEKLPTRGELLSDLGMNIKDKFILVLQHPVSDEVMNAGNQMKETIEAVKKFDMPAVFIYPHADAGGRRIIDEIQKEKNNPLFKIFPSLEYKKFLALEREASVWVGNSSAALIESSSFKTPVVNVGNRQIGRERGHNVLDADYDRNKIYKAIHKSLNDKKYLNKLKKIKNPWGDGRTGIKIAKILEKIELSPKILNKQICY